MEILRLKIQYLALLSLLVEKGLLPVSMIEEFPSPGSLAMAFIRSSVFEEGDYSIRVLKAMEAVDIVEKYVDGRIDMEQMQVELNAHPAFQKRGDRVLKDLTSRARTLKERAN